MARALRLLLSRFNNIFSEGTPVPHGVSFYLIFIFILINLFTCENHVLHIHLFEVSLLFLTPYLLGYNMIQQDLVDIDHVLLRIRESDRLNRRSLFADRKLSHATFLKRKIGFIFL